MVIILREELGTMYGPCAMVDEGAVRTQNIANTLKIIYNICIYLYIYIYLYYILFLFIFYICIWHAVARAQPHVSLHSANCCSAQESCSASNSKPRRRDSTKFSPFVVLLMTKAALKPYSPEGGYELPSSAEQT